MVWIRSLKKLRNRGIRSRIIGHTNALTIIESILNHQKRFGKKPVILIGHSWGGNEAIKIAQGLLKKKVRVNYMAIIAATNPPPIPRNVLKTTNYYFKTNGWGKPILRGKGARGRILNIDLSNASGINHFNVDESRKIQNQIIRNILRFIRSKKRA